ncbi:RhoGAP domain protein, partial [Cooperia oncophora]
LCLTKHVNVVTSRRFLVDLSGIPPSRSFLERLDYESELGTVDPFEEDFSAIARYEIVEVIADGDRVGRPIIVIYAYRLPPSKSIDHAQLLRYLQSILDKVVDLDYTIVYFHYGLRSHNKPPIKWLFQAYKVLDRRFKKNLKALYVVHPTRFIKIIWGLFRPFISSKFEDKFHYVNCIKELEEALSVARLNLPQPIRTHDEQLLIGSGQASGDNRSQTPPTPPRPTQQFGVSLEFILSHHPDHDVPPIVTELIEFLTKHALDVEGIFRKSANVGREHIDFENDPEYVDNHYVACIHASVLLKTFLRSLGEPVTTNALYPRLAALAGLSNILSHHPDHDVPPIVTELIEFLTKHALDVEGIFRKSANVGSIRRLQERINRGEHIDFENDPEYVDNHYVACIHASVLLKTFLRSLGEPVTTNALYPRLAALAEIPKKEKTPAVKEFVALLPRPNYLLLQKVVHFLTLVAANHNVNLMTANNLSVVFGPNLTWPTDQQVPIAQLNNLNNFCYRLIVDYDQIFKREIDNPTLSPFQTGLVAPEAVKSFLVRAEVDVLDLL